MYLYNKNPFLVYRVSLPRGRFGRKDFFSLQIFNVDFETTIVQQLPATGPEEVLGTVGGLLGLMIGASVLSVLEMVEMMMRLIFALAGKLKAKAAKIAPG